MVNEDLTDTPPWKTWGKVHLIGIGGVGMSGLARLLLAHGVAVSGSDNQNSATVEQLREAGARIFLGQRAENLEEVNTVVYSTAVTEDNPERRAAVERGLRLMHRSELLVGLMSQDKALAVAGTHGKTTTTAMLTMILQQAGWKPSFAIGAQVPDLGVNAALGAADTAETESWFVAEADESDGSFVNFSPELAIVTNLEADHLDHYGSLEAVIAAFHDFSSRILPGGSLIYCVDDPGSLALGQKENQEGRVTIGYGRGEQADFRLSGTTGHLVIHTPTGEQFPLQLQVPGEHNALNAVASFAASQVLGVAADVALAALRLFRGAQRRFEFKGQRGGVRVYDDYAHHPTEVRVTLAAARDLAAQDSSAARVLVLFQPHLFSRTRDFARDFAQALSLADKVWVLPIFPAREQAIPGVSSALIAEAGQEESQANEQLRLVEDPLHAVAELAAEARPGDIILTVGAGDVTQYGLPVVEKLAGDT